MAKATADHTTFSGNVVSLAAFRAARAPAPEPTILGMLTAITADLDAQKRQRAAT